MSSQALIEVVLDAPVGRYAEKERMVGPWRPRGRTLAGVWLWLRYVWRYVWRRLWHGGRERIGYYFIPAEIVNAHTVSRRRLIPEFEATTAEETTAEGAAEGKS